MNAITIRKKTLITRNGRSMRSMCRKTSWWLIHMIPIVAKASAYAAYDGHACRSCEVSDPAPSGRTSRMRSVAAIAKTPSLNVSSLAVLTRVILGSLHELLGITRPERDLHRAAAAGVADRRRRLGARRRGHARRRRVR